MADEAAPNQGATGSVWATDAAAAAESGDPSVAPTGAGAPINQGAPGSAPGGAGGESPLSAATQGGAFAQRPELFVGAAFAGGFVLAQILRRFGR